jgi:hypothetical protein
VRPRVWFYRPVMYWYGWRTLRPFWFGNSEPRDPARDGTHFGRTLVLGWTITGQVVIWLRDVELPEEDRYDPRDVPHG